MGCGARRGATARARRRSRRRRSRGARWRRSTTTSRLTPIRPRRRPSRRNAPISWRSRARTTRPPLPTPSCSSARRPRAGTRARDRGKRAAELFAPSSREAAGWFERAGDSERAAAAQYEAADREAAAGRREVRAWRFSPSWLDTHRRGRGRGGRRRRGASRRVSSTRSRPVSQLTLASHAGTGRRQLARCPRYPDAARDRRSSASCAR